MQQEVLIMTAWLPDVLIRLAQQSDLLTLLPRGT